MLGKPLAELSSAPDGVLGKGLWAITQMTSHERAHTLFSDCIKLPLLTLGHVLPLVSPELGGVLTNRDPWQINSSVQTNKLCRKQGC